MESAFPYSGSGPVELGASRTHTRQKRIYLIAKRMARGETPNKRRRRDVSTTDRGACNASGAVGPPCRPLLVEASRGACAASKRDSADLAQPRLSPVRNCAPSGACCEIVDDELSNSSDCYAISAVGCRHIARSAGLTACAFMSFCPVSSYVPLSLCLSVQKAYKNSRTCSHSPGSGSMFFIC